MSAHCREILGRLRRFDAPAQKRNDCPSKIMNAKNRAPNEMDGVRDASKASADGDELATQTGASG